MASRNRMAFASKLVLLFSGASLALSFQNCSQATPDSLTNRNTTSSASNGGTAVPTTSGAGLYTSGTGGSSLVAPDPSSSTNVYSGSVADGVCVSSYATNPMAIPGVQASGGQLIAFTKSDGSAAIWNMQTQSIAVAQGIVCQINQPGWYLAAIGDFNGDSNPDLLWRNSDGRVIIWIMNGLTRTQTKLLSATVSSDWQIQATGDFNGDGSDDLVFRSSSTGYVTFWTMNGINEPNVSGTSLFPPSGGSDNNWKIQGVGQFNPQTDNYTDILWRNSTGELLVWLMNSDGMSVASQTFLPQSPSADYVTVGVGVITNAYGLPYTDLVFYNPTTNDVWFWSLYQLKPTTTHVTKPGSWTPVGLVDLNRDGLAEIEFMNGNTVSVWSLNNLPNNIPSFSLNMIQSGWTPFHYAR